MVHRLTRNHGALGVLAVCAALNASPASAAITDFPSWTEVTDPFHPAMSSTVDNDSQVTLRASGAVPSGTDIGYQSIDAGTVAGARRGFYFAADSDFRVAVDYALSFSSSMGLGGIGFGIGEDGAGVNSAGIGIGFLNGTLLGVSGAGRVGDVDQGALLPADAPLSVNGRLFVEYDSASGDVLFGINATSGSAAPSHQGSFSGIQHQWNDDDLLVSFFLRSDQVSILGPLSSGSVEAVFSNFEVLEGTPIAAVPLPASVWLLGTLLSLAGLFRRR